MDELIARGGGGAVFRVYQGSGRRRTEKAVKLISVDMRYVDLSVWENKLRRGIISQETYDQKAWEAIDELIPELRFMAKMADSAHVMGYEDYLFFETKEDHCWNVLILMELLKPLAQHMTRQGANQMDILYMWRDISEVLQTCATKNILHLDIKDANIMVDRNGRYKLIDWGQACEQDHIQKLIGERRSVRFGTESYMAPEVYHNDPPRAYDARADIYSLGIVIYHYYNGMRLPFASKPWPQLSETERENIKHRRLQQAEPLPRPDRIDNDIWDVLKRACAYAPEDRYASASELKNSIERLISRRISQKNRKTGLIVGTLAGAAVLLTVFVLKPNNIPTSGPQTSAPQTSAPPVASTPTAKPSEPTSTPTIPRQSLPQLNMAPQVFLSPALLAGQRLDTRSGTLLELSGRADPNFELMLLVGDEPVASCTTDQHGNWQMTVDVAGWPQNQRLQLTVSYVFSGQRLRTSENSDTVVVLDTHTDTPLITSDVLEGATVITGTVEPRSAVHGLRGQEHYEAQVDLYGNFTMQVPALRSGDEVTVVVTDLVNNTAQCVLVVDEEERRPITLAQLPERQKPASGFVLAGTAEPDRDIRVMWTLNGQERAQIVRSGQTGEWQTEVDLSEAENDTLCMVAAAYADRNYTVQNVRAEVLMDAVCELTPDVETPHELMTSIAGQTEPLAHVTMNLNGQYQTLQADRNGRFSFDNVVLKVGQRINIVAMDACGNQTEWSGIVKLGDRSPITLKALNLENGYLNGESTVLRVMGTAQPGFEVKVIFRGSENLLKANENGKFVWELNLTDVRPGDLLVKASYADGRCEEQSGSVTVPYDKEGPRLTFHDMVGENVLEEATELLRGKAEPGARVILRYNSEEFQATADDSGEFEVFLPLMVAGDEAQISAWDAAGNETTLTLAIVAEVKDARVHIERPYADEKVANGKLGINANILMRGDVRLYYTVERGSEVVARYDVARDSLRAMSDKNLQEERARYSDLSNNYVGYTLKERVEIPTDRTAEYTLNFYTTDLGSEPVLLASTRFVSESRDSEAPDEEVSDDPVVESDDVVLTDSYGFGLDASETSTFAPTQVYFTGWYWSARKDAYFDVVIDGTRYTQQKLIDAGGKLDIDFGLRRVRTEFSADLVANVKPIENSAGVVVMIDLSFLPAGRHDVQLVLIRGSEERYMPARTIRTSESIPHDAQLPKTLRNQWR
ncbi:MAG: protein kinase [Clostridia bacterium]|nr:protein kinase [Clostridia bacterium]